MDLNYTDTLSYETVHLTEKPFNTLTTFFHHKRREEGNPLEDAVVEHWRRRVNLKNSRAEKDLGVGEGRLLVRLRDENVGLTSNASWDGGRDFVT